MLVSIRRQRGLGTIVVALLGPSCALHTRERALAREACDFIVHNQTSQALEIRMQVRAFSTSTIGALNPGEVLTWNVACTERDVLVIGVEIPSQVGAPLQFGIVEGWADLVEGDRVHIDLHWP